MVTEPPRRRENGVPSDFEGVHEHDGPLGLLGLELFADGDDARGRFEVTESLFAAGTDRMRVGVLAVMTDFVAGLRPTGPVNPTVRLRTRVIGELPTSGGVAVECRPLKVGRRLFVAEVLMTADGAEAPFAWGSATFMNNPIGGPWSYQRHGVGRPGVRFEDLLPLRRPAPGSVVLVPESAETDHPNDTVQGGIQAVLAELAADDLAGGPAVAPATDLEISYLNASGPGPVRADAAVLGAGPQVPVRVTLTSERTGKLVAFVDVTCSAAP